MHVSHQLDVLYMHVSPFHSHPPAVPCLQWVGVLTSFCLSLAQASFLSPTSLHRKALMGGNEDRVCTHMQPLLMQPLCGLLATGSPSYASIGTPLHASPSVDVLLAPPSSMWDGSAYTSDPPGSSSGAHQQRLPTLTSGEEKTASALLTSAALKILCLC